MAYEQRDNSGSLFKNDRKEKDTHPDRTGTAMIDGVTYWVSGWVKQDRDGKPWLSLAFKRKDQQGADRAESGVAANPARQSPSRSMDADSDIPF